MSNKTLQEMYGRKGRVITDQDVREISRVEAVSYDLKIGDVMVSDVKSVRPDIPMNDLLEIMRQGRISGTPVVEGGNLVGLVSIEDLIHAMRKGELAEPISQYMARNVVTVKVYEPVVRAIEIFSEQRFGRLPVMDENDRLVGIITKGDITSGLLLALQKDYHEEEVRRYRASHLFKISRPIAPA